MGLKITTRRAGDTAILELEGRLWILDLPLRDRIRELLQENYRFFVFNLEKVDYMDSSGLGQLVALWTSVRTKEGNLCVLKPSARVRRLLSVTRLNIVFDIFNDEEHALVAVRREA